ncbi:putative rac serine-threonine kinase [Leptomonas seymouri]|uniref:non-specific serine/threonine protein kinase n=1 Tax=Leptomonas seymouri TaxID=5684 RepID=A0A0N1I550_LEPSE|nr:putative rac serine-threonine kinase [Leptomonas seymouri]|eukprot:KPI86702.1 putative rac serine-threonine kinase [Leptomonas seymouri]
MGVAFSQSTPVALPYARAPNPQNSTQLHSTPFSPSSHSTVGVPADMAALCRMQARTSDIPGAGDAAAPTPSSSHTTVPGSKTPQRNGSNDCCTPQSTLAQQIQSSLKALALDWTIVDHEIDLITVRFAAALLTSRLRVPKGTTRGAELGDDAASNGSVSKHSAHAEYAGDVLADADVAATSTTTTAAADNDDVGPQELYVSAALRLAALQLGRDGLQRVIVALTFLANGGESREDRRQRRNTSLTTSNPIRRVESSQEINHFQHGAGYTGPTVTAGAAGSGALCNTTGNTFNALGSTGHSIAGPGSALVSRRFSTAPRTQAQPQSPGPNTCTENRNGCYSSAGPSLAGCINNNVAETSNSSIDHLACTTPARCGGGNSASVGQGYSRPLRSPSSARSGEEGSCFLNASPLYHHHRSVSPLNAAANGNFTVGRGPHFFSSRPAAELDCSHHEHSYNNMLLTSMNARSTLLSPLRTGLRGELYYSNSSFATLMSLPTEVGAHASRSHRGGGGENSSTSTLRSPGMPFFHSITQWVVPPALLGSQGTSIAGAVSANSSIQNSVFMASPPSARDSRLRSESCSRRLIQPLLPQQMTRLSAVGAAGAGRLSRPASEEANMNALTYQLPQAVGGGGGGVVGVEGGYEGAAVSTPPSPGLCGTALRFLRPEAVLTALCSVFAHLHLSTDDVTNLVALLVMAALEVQTDALLRRLAETDEGVPEGLHAPSMKQVRTAVKDSLTVLLTPMYNNMRFMLSAAAGIVESDVQASPLSSDVLEVSGSRNTGGGTQQPQRQHTPLKPNTQAAIFTASPICLPPAVHPSALAHAGDRNLTAPVPRFPCTPLRSTADGVDSSCHADLPALAHVLHDFFESKVPLESTPNTWSACTAAATARAMAAHRLSSVHRVSGSRQHLHSLAAMKIATDAASPLMYSSWSDSAAGPTPSGSMLSQSDITDAVATLVSTFSGRASASFSTPTQEEVRCASSFLMDVETAFVLHYAEAIPDVELGKHKPATAPSVPSTPTKQHQRTAGSSSRPGLHIPSAPHAAAAPPSSSSAKTHSWRRRCDAAPDVFVQFSSNATVWPLRTRMLIRRHAYVYVYDAMASTAALLRDQSLYTGEGVSPSTAQEREPAFRTPHPCTPIVLIDLNKATEEKHVNDLQVVSGPGDVEVVSLMPSRVSHSSLISPHPRRACTNPTVVATAAPPTPQSSTPNSALSPSSSCINNNHIGSNRAPSSFDNLLNLSWMDAYQQDTDVYRMKGSTGTMYLLTVPADAHRVELPAATASSSRTTKEDDGAAVHSTTALTDDAVRSRIIRCFERSRLARPAVLSLASTAATATSGASKEGEIAAPAASDKDPCIQCVTNAGSSEVLAPELGNEPVRIAVYPLRLIYKGILHHFFFPNPSMRDHWYQQLLQLSWMTQSRWYLEVVAAAPHDVERFMRRRISFPTGPGAFECLDMLGAGTFGRVLLVQHKLSRRLFAMKVIRKGGFHGIRNIIEARLEKKILEQLDCPYIMKIHSSFQTDSRVYLLFDYLPGAELLLHTQSAHSNHFNEVTSRFYIAELAIAVEYLRVRGIVHRDIKGDNLVLDAEGHVVLTDFGFAKNIVSTPLSDPSASPQVIRQHTSCGTLAYIAPEVLCNSRRRNGYGLAVDWWSLGVVLFTFLTGYFPFLKQTSAETSQSIVSSPLQFPPRPALSENARSLLDQLLQKDPEKRITCLADLRHHRFFEGFDWNACAERRLPPPLVLHKDSYRSPCATAEARLLLQDRVRRSLAWSSGQTDIPYMAPTHSHLPSSDKLTAKHQPQLEEEKAELKLIEQAYGSDCMPKPLFGFNDVFGPFFDQQERCGSDRDESDVEDLGMEDYVADLSHNALDTLRRLRESGMTPEMCSFFSEMSFNSACKEHLHAGSAGDSRGGGATGLLRSGRVPGMPVLPTLMNFSEDLYSDVALAKYNPPPN